MGKSLLYDKGRKEPKRIQASNEKEGTSRMTPVDEEGHEKEGLFGRR